jgi:23S rRNA (adenine2030-N6)-methyltransferase
LLSYRHCYHAGNHADVFKHIVAMLVIKKLKAKEKPFIYIDTHSGSGLYDLGSEETMKRSEFLSGIGKLLQHEKDFPELEDYFSLISTMNPGNRLIWHPGSPRLAAHLLRKQDHIILMELHNSEIGDLRENMHGDKRIEIHHRDGFEGLIGILPPDPARGLVLIDPAYEVKEDYKRVVSCLQEAYRRWPTGIYAIWYPLLSSQRDLSSTMLQQLARGNFKNILVAEITVCEQQKDFGMHGSGMAIINAPWMLDLQLTELLPRLTGILALDSTARWKVVWKISPA